LVFNPSPSSDDAEPPHKLGELFSRSTAKRKTRNLVSKNKQKKHKQAASPSGQNRLGQSKDTDSQLELQDIARHCNKLCSREFDQLSSDSAYRHSHVDMHPSPGLHPHVDLAAESPLHAQQDPSSEPHLDPSSDPVSEAHPDQSVDHHTEQVDAVSDDEGDETYVAEPYSSQSEPESASLQMQDSQKRSGATAGRSLN
jgi:hypothetical protein